MSPKSVARTARRLTAVPTPAPARPTELPVIHLAEWSNLEAP
jgi:hypothetical protein